MPPGRGFVSAGCRQSIVKTDSILLCHNSPVSVSAQTSFISPVQELQAEVGECLQDYFLGHP